MHEALRKCLRLRHRCELKECLYMQTPRYNVGMSANTDEFVVFGPNGFGAAIKEFRHRRGLTQQELATRADLYRS